MVQLPDLPDFARTPLRALMQWAQADTLPPVDDWHPAHCGAIDIHIAANGRWFHEGGEITRPAMVRLFSRILRREADGSYVLVTPAERLTITVEDAPFVAVAMKVEGADADATIAFSLNTGDVVIAGAQHMLRFDQTLDGEPRPRVQVRGTADRALWARLARPVWLELAERALAEDAAAPALWSGGVRFELDMQ